ncbi:hypothetical protein HAX54_000241 [Datura stramonium]|uniref:Uncharacterized protein n=1 Tax=Datura stramonium TaxID=4076 RepID=A0ABS8WSF8_DATST|nr:hypothetical protein [Datura stramonium]
MDNDIFEWKKEEEVVGEMFADFFLKDEELEESATHPGKRHLKAQTVDKMLIPTSIPGSSLDIGILPDEMPITFYNTLSGNISSGHIGESLVYFGDRWLIALRLATGGSPVVLRESPVISRIDLPNTAFSHKFVGHRCFAVQDRHYTSGNANGYDIYS